MPAAYLNALGKGVHVVTVNDYLAKRDANEWVKYTILGLKAGYINNDQDDFEEKNYNCDITYATNSELGLYLRDNMKYSKR